MEEIFDNKKYYANYRKSPCDIQSLGRIQDKLHIIAEDLCSGDTNFLDGRNFRLGKNYCVNCHDSPCDMQSPGRIRDELHILAKDL